MLKKALALALTTLCLSHVVHADIDFAALDAYANAQNYGPIRDLVYNAPSLQTIDQMQLQQWLRDKSDAGHVPMMYFLVRSFYLANFNGYDPVTIQEALKYRYISLVRIVQDEHCRKGGPKNEVYHLYNKRYEKKFFANVPVNSVMRNTAVEEMHEWFKRWGTFQELPAPYWVGFVEAGAWYESHICRYLPVDVARAKNDFLDYTEDYNPRVKGFQNFQKGNFNV